MPAPSPLPPLDRQDILARFPWISQSGQSMVVGSDMDAILSAVLAHHVLGWEMVGVYDLHNIYAAGPREGLRDAVWVDLDVYPRSIKSLGHHVLQIDGRPNPNHAQTLNLNMLQGVVMRPDFTRKYPLGTFYFLAWLWDVNLPLDHPLALPLYWHPDSAWINGQRYAKNVKDWVQHCIPLPPLVRTLDDIATPAFEDTFPPLYAALARCGWQEGAVQGRSSCRGLGGWQCQIGASQRAPYPQPPSAARMAALLALISQITGWRTPTWPARFARTYQGRRAGTFGQDEFTPHDDTGLADFLDRQGVFSYAFPYLPGYNKDGFRRRDFNYTIFGEDWTS